MPFYRIQPGASFREPDNSVKTGGEYVELSKELAEQHRDKVDADAPLTKAQHDDWLAEREAERAALLAERAAEQE